MPSLLTASAIFIGGLVLLAKGSDMFVEAAAKIAKILGISEFIIGLTLIAVGTSLPELGSGLVASYNGNTEIVLGNVIGSNIANIALILGLSAVLAPIITQKTMFYRDGVMLMASSLLFYYFAYDAAITAMEGVLLIILFVLYNAVLLEFMPKIPHFREYVDYIFDLDAIVEIEKSAGVLKDGVNLKTPFRMMKLPLRGFKRMMHARKAIMQASSKEETEKREGYLQRLRSQRERIRGLKDYRELLRKAFINDVSLLVISGGAIYLGAEFFVGSALDIAEILGVGPSIVGLTIVSVGTSLPELAVSVQSARKGFSDMVIGNVIGSNISNITLVVGLCAIVAPISLGVNEAMQHINIYQIIPFMLFVSFSAFIAIRSNWSIRRFEGFFFLMLYAGFLFWLGTSLTVF